MRSSHKVKQSCPNKVRQALFTVMGKLAEAWQLNQILESEEASPRQEVIFKWTMPWVAL